MFQKERRRKPRNEIKSLGNKRYWNEFDDEDTPEPYTILVRPSTPNADGEMEEDSTLSEFLCSPIAEVFSRLCGRREKARHSDEYTPLIGRLDSDSETETDARVRPLPNHSDYDTFGGPVVRRETNEYSGSHMIFLAISFFMLIVTGSIAVGESLSGHKHKHRNFGKLVVIDLSVFVGILISLISGVIGVTIFLVGRTRASWLHRVTVWGVFAGMCAGCGVILTVASRDIIDKAA